MAFTVEDGTGKTDANAYVSVAYVDDYFTTRSNSAWTGTEAVKQAAIIAATDYIEQRFSNRFAGYKYYKEQALSWPRQEAFDPDGYRLDGVDVVPRLLKKACAEYALRALSAKLLSDPSNSAQVAAVREKVGPIEEETTYVVDGSYKSDLVSAFNIPEYPTADLWIERLVSSRQALKRG